MTTPDDFYATAIIVEFLALLRADGAPAALIKEAEDDLAAKRLEQAALTCQRAIHALSSRSPLTAIATPQDFPWGVGLSMA